MKVFLVVASALLSAGLIALCVNWGMNLYDKHIDKKAAKNKHPFVFKGKDMGVYVEDLPDVLKLHFALLEYLGEDYEKFLKDKGYMKP